MKSQAREDNVFNGAAALGFYLMLAIFPALIFLLSLLPYLPIEGLESALMDLLHESMPGEAAGLLEGTVQSLVSERQGGLLSFGLLGTLWAASTGMYAVMRELNQTYRVEEGRSFVKARATALLLTLLFGTLVISAFALIVLGGALEQFIASRIGDGDALGVAFDVFRWVIILGFLLVAFALVYYLGPNVDRSFKWVSPGSLVGVVLLVVAALGFRLYVRNFGNYEATYGGLGAVIVLMLWLYVIGLVVLLGSEINVAFEHHASHDDPRRDAEPESRSSLPHRGESSSARA